MNRLQHVKNGNTAPAQGSASGRYISLPNDSQLAAFLSTPTPPHGHDVVNLTRDLEALIEVPSSVGAGRGQGSRATRVGGPSSIIIKVPCNPPQFPAHCPDASEPFRIPVPATCGDTDLATGPSLTASSRITFLRRCAFTPIRLEGLFRSLASFNER